MQIIEKGGAVLFSTIKTGECFKMNDEIYIKTNRTNTGNGFRVNAVCLADGNLASIGDTTEVTQVNAKVVAE